MLFSMGYVKKSGEITRSQVTHRIPPGAWWPLVSVDVQINRISAMAWESTTDIPHDIPLCIIIYVYIYIYHLFFWVQTYTKIMAYILLYIIIYCQKSYHIAIFSFSQLTSHDHLAHSPWVAPSTKLPTHRPGRAGRAWRWTFRPFHQQIHQQDTLW